MTQGLFSFRRAILTTPLNLNRMRKVLSFSAFLMAGLFVSQYLPVWAGGNYNAVKAVSNVLLYVCLSFIMINVGREFEVDKSRWQTYAKDYGVAMATAAMPWFLIAIYYVLSCFRPNTGIVGKRGKRISC